MRPLETYSAYASRRCLSADDGDKLAINKRPAATTGGGGQVRRGGPGAGRGASLGLSLLLLLLLASSASCQTLEQLANSASLIRPHSLNSDSLANHSEANSHNNVIPSTAFSAQPRATLQLPGWMRQQQEEPLPARQLKYHLNHLQPPSLVPITVTVERRHLQQQQPAAAAAAHDENSLPLDQKSPSDQKLGGGGHAHQLAGSRQLQLPLQLHLKLKPLPLPMGPPQREMVEKGSAGPPPTTTRRPAARADTPTTSQTTPTTTTMTTTQPTPGDGERRRRDLMAFTWREAKRILLLSSMWSTLAAQTNGASSGGGGGAQLERRSGDEAPWQPLEGRATPTQRPAENDESPTTAATTTTTQREQTTTTTGQSLEPTSDSSLTAPKSEVRRQRHSSQQQLQGQPQAAAADDNRIHTLAASMLPLFWPSFQLAQGGAGGRKGASSWPDEYLAKLVAGAGGQVHENSSSLAAAFSSPVAESAQAPTLMAPLEAAATLPVAAANLTTPTPTSEPALEKEKEKERKKARKPSYLLASLEPRATPYPDSTRLASKYPMPRLKFQPARAESEQPGASGSATPTTLAPKKQRAPLAEGKLQPLQQVQVQVPKGLSKLIEQQLLLNASSLLMLQSNARNASLAPSTSVSKVVRLSSVSSLAPPTLAPPGGENATLAWKQHEASAKLSTAQTANLGDHQRSQPTTTTTRVPLRPTMQPQPQPSATKQLADASDKRARDELIGSNKVLPEEEEQQPAASTATSATPAAAASVAKAAASSKADKFNGAAGHQQQQHLSARHQQQLAGKNIKLFHFKRKPDMNKLPFYKKPLNYTELGWSADQIQEHLEGLAALVGVEAPVLVGGVAAGGNRSEESREAPEVAQDSLVGAPTASGGGGELLKRKRRGKSQFERLMAELHGAGLATPAELGAAAADPAPASSSSEAAEPPRATPTMATPIAAAPTSEPEEERVPVMRKKAEPLVMKSMFFVMNQKRRPSGEQAAAAASTSTTPRPTTTPTSTATSSAEPPKSKPIIRMRRKHHGEQPLAANQRLEAAAQSPWRPSRPLWSAAAAKRADQGQEKLLLVPSSVLTPSGSQLVPLYAAGGPSELDEQSRLVNDLFAWRPARALSEPPLWSLEQPQQAAPANSKPLGAELAQSQGGPGERLALVASSQPPVHLAADAAPRPLTISMGGGGGGVALEQQQQQQQAQEAQASSTQAPQQQQPQLTQTAAPGELRVPKLLVKPARPAKYSLNGYIPKPSLGSQATSALAAPPAQPGAKQAAPSQAQKLAKARLASANSAAVLAAAAAAAAATVGAHKDLDSSTSNEIFSRRRGLQQHQRSAQAKAQLALDTLLSGSGQSGAGFTHRAARLADASGGSAAAPAAKSVAAAANLSPTQQMEENKRKYLAQQQLSRSLPTPTLSVHKANLIKAKLGLAVSNQLEPSGAKQRQQQQQQQQANTAASTSSVLTAEPNAEPNNELVGPQQQAANTQLIGAPLNSIPKTDFECTDKKGKFVAGLFADHKTGCQVWHLCSNNRKYSFLCPTGTIFNAKLRICDWRYNVKCETSSPL